MIADVAVLLGGARLTAVDAGAIERRQPGAPRSARTTMTCSPASSRTRGSTTCSRRTLTSRPAIARPRRARDRCDLRARELRRASVSLAALRRALARPKDEREAAGRTELSSAARPRNGLADAYDRLARSARQARALVDQHEVFALDHLNVLRDLGSRMTAEHIFRRRDRDRVVAAACAGFARESHEPRQPRHSPRRRVALYPAGGFSAITPGGSNASVENLVTSELVYMEDGPEPDVFTLRYVEGELLYYTRDDSVFRRHRQVIGIALGADLDDARVKDRDLPWQRLILALGLVVAATRWLAEQLGDHALTIRLAFPPNLLGEERGHRRPLARRRGPARHRRDRGDDGSGPRRPDRGGLLDRDLRT